MIPTVGWMNTHMILIRSLVSEKWVSEGKMKVQGAAVFRRVLKFNVRNEVLRNELHTV